MQLIDVIQQRRAVREYTEDVVEQATIARLIEVAIQSPSAMNLQPWAFAVALNRHQIDQWGRRAKDWLIAHQSELGFSENAEEILGQPNFAIFYHAPALVIVLATSPGTQSSEDCCLAAQNLMLTARDQGIGSCWIGFARPWLDLASTKKELGIPAAYHVVAPIILGYPTSWPEPHGRKAAEVHWL
jgi:nitroreductase